MKIAIIGTRGYPYVYSGYETFVKELSERLVQKGVDITVYCHKNLFNNFPPKVNQINLVYIPTIERKLFSQFIHSFQSIIHACLKDFDIIFVVNPANGPFGLLTKLFKKKTAINVDGIEWLRPKWKGFGSKYFYFASKIATKLYDEVITDSIEMNKIYNNEFAKTSTVIAYGANIRYSKNSYLIKQWGLDKGNYYLIVGRLIPDNNSEFIIKEFINSRSCKNLVIVGDVPYNDKYAKSVKSNNDPRLIFTGYVYDQNILAELYHNCFAYIHGHEYGGTNPTMLKALAYGAGIIALDTVFTREMLNDSAYGLFFQKENECLKTLIQRVETNSGTLRNLREKSRNRIVENYTWGKITDQYLQFFKRMISK